MPQGHRSHSHAAPSGLILRGGGQRLFGAAVVCGALWLALFLVVG